MLTLDQVAVRPVTVPLQRPIVSKVGTFAEWPLILIDLYTREGVVGRSYLEPYLAGACRYLKPMIEDLAAAQRGHPVAPRAMFDAARNALHLVGREGLTMIAGAGLDMAAWDALAKHAEMPLAALLGGVLKPIPAYNSNGLWLAPVDQLGGEAESLLAEGGFSALKVRLGRPDLADDLDAIRAVREVAGPDAPLMCDFNQGLSLAEALHRCRALDDQGLYWFEEPIAYDNLQGLAQLTRELATPVQIGENFYGPRAMQRALAVQAADLVMPDLMRIGGVTGWLDAAAVAAAAGIPVSTHLYPEVSAHLMCVTETAHWLEWQNWANPLLREPFAVERGHVVVPDRPGNGIEWDEAAVARYSAD